MVKRPHRRAHEKDVKVRLGSLKDQLVIMARKRGFVGLSPYIRELCARGLVEDTRLLPGMFLTLRPGTTVFREKSDGVFVPLAQGLGGERVWVLAHVSNLPTSMGGVPGYLCDITAGDTHGGLEGRSVIVKCEDVGGV